ncbi:flagellar hook-length control protein FliK [Rheinheimera sp.]|uniref:flagellar hook-length control protein FliK n=1 Tax=Rheinheimera sp. TaxID=1869214 RepID=UPI004047E152
MNQINLETVLQQAATGKVDNASVKLLVAQVYQAQIQQLTDGGAKLQLAQPGGALQLTLAPAMAAQLQPLLASIPGAVSRQSLPVMLQFQGLSDGNVQLTVQHSASTVVNPLNSALVRQLLLSAYLHSAPAQLKAADAQLALSLTAQLVKRADGYSVQLPQLGTVTLDSKAVQSLLQVKPDAAGAVIKLLLQLMPVANKPQLTVALTAVGSGNSPNLLNPAGQQLVLQQLVKLFNQQPLPVSNLQQLLASDNKTAALSSTNQLQLLLSPSSGKMPSQVQLVPLPNSMQLKVSPQQFNRPLLLSNQAATTLPAGAAINNSHQGTNLQLTAGQTASYPASSLPADTAIAAAVKTAAQPTAALPLLTPSALTTIQQAAVQQAWRQLLPLLPTTVAPLADMPLLPEPIRQIFALLRQTQLDSSKVHSSAQLQSQLSAALAFQPLQQPSASSTSSGTLAVAIQLLLGHLLQKPSAPAAATAPQLARLISQLEPAQASGVLRQLASHSSSLQQSQLASLDSSVAQQLVLQLPLAQQGQSQFCQLLLEQREESSKQSSEKRHCWQLTMRFDLQQHGAMMVVAKLSEQQLRLQFYTEQESAKALAERFLPILTDRCTMQGLQVEQAECVLGKIPASLLPRANSLLEIKV